MRKFVLVGAVGAHLLLSACNLLGIRSADSGASDTKAEEASANASERQAEKAAEPTANSSGAEARSEPTETADPNDWIVGRWGDENCQQTLEFASGGEFVTAQGTGQWSLNGTTLTVSGTSGEREIQIERQDDNRIMLNDPETGQLELTRC